MSDPATPTGEPRRHQHQWVDREGVTFGVRIGYTHCYICGKIIRTWAL